MKKHLNKLVPTGLYNPCFCVEEIQSSKDIPDCSSYHGTTHYLLRKQRSKLVEADP